MNYLFFSNRNGTKKLQLKVSEKYITDSRLAIFISSICETNNYSFLLNYKENKKLPIIDFDFIIGNFNLIK